MAAKNSSSSLAASSKCSRIASAVLADTAIRGHDLDEAKATEAKRLAESAAHVQGTSSTRQRSRTS